ncbi:rCG45735 [Rattus norvegicus]|uniref:RCG45735 n=1 Tax=Rattus norvegicus TaxID=10116 RepID=A6JUC2_RAT|nr:rCG45735 [Rattus norvegicus]
MRRDRAKKGLSQLERSKVLG